jgi:dipeptidyl aminopeptidase/acylaminoacyl peptidase
MTLQPITSGPVGDSEPAISPDGTLIAFSRTAGGGQRVFVIGVQGGTPRQLTFAGERNFSPAWSPRGDEIAYLSLDKDEPARARIHTVSAGGGPPRVFTRARAAPTGRLAWAPGARLLYASADGGALRLLDPATEQETPLLEKEWGGPVSGSWLSPDGKRMAVEWTAPAEPSRGGIVTLLSLDDGRGRVVAENAPRVLGFAADGWSVLALESAGAGGTIVRLPLAGGRASPWATLPGGAGERVMTDLVLVESFDPEVR